MSTQHFGDAPTTAKTQDQPTLVERILNRLFKKREIVNCARDIYLHRWFIIRTAPFALFLHKFVRSDEDRALHCHPWDFIVIPIWRGYVEHNLRPCDCYLCEAARDGHPHGPPPDHLMLPSRTRVLPILGTRFRRAEYRHRVELIKGVTWGRRRKLAWASKLLGLPIGKMEMPSWSLFIRFRKRREWGFWEKTGFVLWSKFWQDKCE